MNPTVNPNPNANPDTRRAGLAAGLAALALATGCATQPASTYDYSAFNASKPGTLLVMPPLNESPEVQASAAVWAQATRPLAEAGYYVLPATLVDETFQQNGVQTPHDAADIPVQKLRQFFGADAAVYLTVKQYGSSYAVVMSETRVDVEARIVDLRNGALLWEGRAQASSQEGEPVQGGGIAALLVGALVGQVIGSTTDAAFDYAATANTRLLGGPRPDGVPPGPRSPNPGPPSPR